jgi:DNA (cytosine-5)-methyltransferase 1
MKRRKALQIADLFCGAGGTSTGALDAAELLGYTPSLTAINHWDTAIATHTANHPTARHLLTAIDNVNPRDIYSAGELDLLWASPECTHHSVARGGKPINEQSRATAWCVVRWADAVQPAIILVENVPEFISWGGIGSNGRPLKGKKGKTFAAWVTALESLGYRVDWRILCAADYGDPTTRKRLFVQAVRGRRKIVWPEPTHARLPAPDMFTLQRPWVAAREIIDWSLEGQSIYERKRPLSDKTMRRIMTGLKKFGLRPFIVPQHSGRKGSCDKYAGRTNSVDDPLSAVTTTSRGIGFVEPFIIQTDQTGSNGGCVHELKKPLGTIVTKQNIALVSPFLVNMKGKSNGADINSPAPTQTAHAPHLHLAEPFLVKMRGTHESQLDSSAQSLDEPLPAAATVNKFGVCEPFIVPNFGECQGQAPRTHSVDEPVPSVTGRGAGNLVEAFLIQVAHGNGKDKNGDARRSRSVDQPLPAVCGNRGDVALCEPSLLPQQSGGSLRSVESPAPTVATDGAIGLVEPFLVKFYGKGAGAQSVEEPLATVTVKDRHALVRPVVVIQGQQYLLDIRFRMLQPHELAGAQGFPRDYKFTGNKTEQVKLIGNAVPCRLARALVYAALSQNSDCDQLLCAE